jgi:hypothetical protein
VATDFTGKTALITGAGRGTEGQLEETRDLLRAQGVPAGRISVVPGDLADEEDRGRVAVAVLAFEVNVVARAAGRAGSTPPCRPGSAARRPSALALACTSGSTGTSPRAP